MFYYFVRICLWGGGQNYKEKSFLTRSGPLNFLNSEIAVSIGCGSEVKSVWCLTVIFSIGVESANELGKVGYSLSRYCKSLSKVPGSF